MVVFLQPFSTGKRQFIETDEKREIACVTYSIIDRMGDTRRVKKVTKAILTMKSLILAQDER